MLADAVTAFDPTADDVRRDPYPSYHWLLRHDPVHRGAHHVWYVSRFGDVRAVLGDERFARTGIRQFWTDLVGPGLLSRIVGDIILFQDEPDHGRLRGVVGPAFSPSALRRLEPVIAATVEDLLRPARARGTMDVVAELAYPLALRAVLGLLGLPDGDEDAVGRWSRAVGRTLDRGASAEDMRQGHAAIAEFADYVEQALAARRDDGEDLLALMLAAHRRGLMSRNEIVSTVVTFIFTGHETVASQVGNGLLSLLNHPDQLDLLRGAPQLVAPAVEECLRYDPAVQSNTRQLTADVELHGRLLGRHDVVVVLAGAANRDPLRYDRPDEFDIRRDPIPSMSFGAGMRYCLGSYLARLQLRTALGALAGLPDLRPATAPEGLTYQPRTMFRGLTRLPVAFTPAG
ncbi:cytochrome P450 [Micromonospora craterilacus]|uniref:Cytochrome P450 n=1 Tax=Micromonospora craterilacus TaxID=1655439 RepID=A0A2W2FI92_9ACTN|nr:cytochrome P450 [Micromonospora craterilacus]PZG24378.1 cytochrome P450 [Micromonospora craterilacus]